MSLVMTTKTYKFKTFQEQIAFDNTLPDDAAYDSLSDPIDKVYETTVLTNLPDKHTIKNDIAESAA